MGYPLADSVPAGLNGLQNIYGNIVLNDTPAVVAARADHLKAKAAQAALVGPAPIIKAAAPIIAAPAPIIKAAAPVIVKSYPLADSVPAAVNGLQNVYGAIVPKDTPSVAAAKADHFAALAAQKW